MRAFFHGRRLYLHHVPAAAPRSAVLYVHPFGEEMNKSRRMAALQARAFAAAGHAVLQIDLHGCGDSDGELAGTSWQRWVDDVAEALVWLQRAHPGAALRLWGLRAGCLLAVAAARHAAADCDFLFWQPLLTGRAWIQQLTRLQRAARLADNNRPVEADDGATMTVAGYTLAADLLAAIGAQTLAAPAGSGRVDWFELSQRPDAELLPASNAGIAAWRAAGFDVQAGVVAGPAFWQTTEIEEAPALLQASLRALAGAALPA